MWIITKDYIGAVDFSLPEKTQFAGKFKEVDIKSCNYDEEKTDKLVHQFRLYDDDGNLYYEGLSSSDSSFAPLNDYGEGNDGCVRIDYLVKKIVPGFAYPFNMWETL